MACTRLWPFYITLWFYFAGAILRTVVDVWLGHGCEVDLHGKEKADPNFQDDVGESRRWCP